MKHTNFNNDQLDQDESELPLDTILLIMFTWLEIMENRI